MAAADYKLCDVCGGKAFYDSNVTDPHYTATWDDSEEAEPIGLAVLCAECNKTHEAIIQPRSAPAGYVPASEVQRAREEVLRDAAEICRVLADAEVGAEAQLGMLPLARQQGRHAAYISAMCAIQSIALATPPAEPATPGGRHDD